MTTEEHRAQSKTATKIYKAYAEEYRMIDAQRHQLVEKHPDIISMANAVERGELILNGRSFTELHEEWKKSK